MVRKEHIGMSDESVEPVQPDAGQGGDGTGGAPYQEYLDRIPEQLREQVEPVFKDWDANFTQRSMEHAEFRKGWEPYQESGINQIDPERVKWLTQFSQILDSDPSQVYEWAKQYAPEEPAPVEEPSGFEFEDPAAQFEQKLTPLAEKMQKFEQWMEAQESQTRESEAAKFVEGQKAELKAKHPGEWTETAEKAVDALVFKYIQADPTNAVPKAWAEWTSIRNALEKDTLQGKVDGGNGALSGGVPDVSAEEPKSMQERHALAKDLIRSQIAATQ